MLTETFIGYIDTTMELLNQQNLNICEIGIIRHHEPTPTTLNLRNTLDALVEDLTSDPRNESTIDREVAMGTACTLDPYLFKLAVKEIVSSALEEAA